MFWAVPALLRKIGRFYGLSIAALKPIRADRGKLLEDDQQHLKKFVNIAADRRKKHSAQLALRNFDLD